MNRFLKIVITVSVLLNLLLAGIIIGDIGHYFMSPKKHITLQDATATLPPDKREHLKNIISHADKDIGALRQKLDDDRKKSADILKTEPFNKAAYLMQMQDMRQLRVQITDRTADAVVGLAAQTTPQERASMADILFPPQ